MGGVCAALKIFAGQQYIGTLETVLPFMAGRSIQLCPQLTEVWGLLVVRIAS